MKSRMATGRCCCEVCAPFTETVWTDNFSSYSTGEDLTPYGYLGAAVTEDNGGILGGNGGGTNGYALRLFRMDFTKWSVFDFTAKSISGYGHFKPMEFGLFGSLSGLSGAMIGTRVEDNIFGTDSMIAKHFSGQTAVSIDAANGDTFRVVATIISFNRVTNSTTEIEFDIDYYHNGSIYHSHLGVTSTQANSIWCNLYYGAKGINLTSDDWDFSAT